MPFGTTLTVLGRTTFKGWINEWHYRESKMLFASLTYVMQLGEMLACLLWALW